MPSPQSRTHASPVDEFRARLARNGLRSTRQRDVIARAFFDEHKHISIDELFRECRRTNPRIGYATVYRTLKLLTACGLAKARQFGDGQTRYEPFVEGNHHDHLICTECGLIVEFEDETIEESQELVARAHGFRITHHRMELYGLCPSCQAD